jgi:hypothetical protein
MRMSLFFEGSQGRFNSEVKREKHGLTPRLGDVAFKSSLDASSSSQAVIPEVRQVRQEPEITSLFTR